LNSIVEGEGKLKRAMMVSFLVVLVVLMGCSNEEQQFEHFFSKK